MKLFITSLANLLGIGLATSRILADVRPPPAGIDDLGGLGTSVGATFLTGAFILAGLWLARKIHNQK